MSGLPSDFESDLTPEYLRSVLDYDPLSGIFRWNVPPIDTVKVGQIAGRVCKSGHRQISVRNKRYMAHRLAWLYVYGEWPKKFLDHKNQNGDDNSIDNLRESTRVQNGYNRGKQSDNKSGFKGVCFHKASGMWMAQITVEKKHMYLGIFITPEEAHMVYVRASKENHGIFSSTGAEHA